MVKRHQQTRKLLAEKHGQVQKLNEIEAYKSYLRDQVEKDTLIFRQLEERFALQNRLNKLQANQQEEINKLKEALSASLLEEKITQLRQEFDRSFKNNHKYDLEM